MGSPLENARGWSESCVIAAGKERCYTSLSTCFRSEDCDAHPIYGLWCRGLEEVQVEREEVIENTFSGDVENVEDLDRLFG